MPTLHVVFWHELSAVQIRLKLQQKSKGGFLSVWKNEIHSKGLRLFGIGLFGSCFFSLWKFFGIIRAQSNCGSTCNIWLRWQFVQTNFWFDSHFDQSCKQLSKITLETVKSQNLAAACSRKFGECRWEGCVLQLCEC